MPKSETPTRQETEVEQMDRPTRWQGVTPCLVNGYLQQAPGTFFSLRLDADSERLYHRGRQRTAACIAAGKLDGTRCFWSGRPLQADILKNLTGYCPWIRSLSVTRG